MSFLYDKDVKYWPSHNSMVLERLVDELEKLDYYNIEYPKAKYFYATSNSLNVDRVHFYKYLSDNNLWDKNNVALFSTHRNNDLGHKGFNYSYVKELRGQCGLNDIDDNFIFYPKPFENENFKTMNYSVLSNVDKLKESYFEMVFETIFEANENMIIQTSEKTFKPLIQKTPFISFSYSHILRELKNLGFKTFDFIFDESYDDMENTHQRLYKVLGEIGKVCNMSLEKLKEYDEIIKDVTEHNFLNVKRLFTIWREQLKQSVNYE
jgi:uncharacterized membrane protein YkgB